MGYSNGQLESSSTSGRGEKGDPGLPGIGFSLTDDGNFDIDSKRLTEVAAPIDNNDAATKEYVDNNLPAIDLSPYLKRDGTTSMTGHLNMNNHKISDLEDATDDNDAVPLKQLKEMTTDHRTNYHLQPSFTFYKDFGDKAECTKGSIPIPGHTDHFELLEAPREGAQSGYAYSSVRLVNNLEIDPNYSIVFEIFGYDGTNIVTDGDSDRLLVTNVTGNANIIDFSHDWFSNYAKAYIIFNSSKRDVNIRLQFRYYGSSNSNFKFLFFSRCVKGIQRSSFDHRLFNVKSTDFSGTILNFEPINMNNEKIINIGNPTDPKDATTKEYVDDEDAKQDIAINDLSSRKADKTYVDSQDSKQDIAINDISTRKADRTEVLLRNGRQSMTGNLLMNGNRIFSLPIPTGSQQPVTKSYLESQIASLPQPDLSLYLKVDGSVSMTGSLQMGGNAITGIRSSSADDAALTVGGAKSTYLPLLGDRGMEGNLDMGGNAITGIRSSSADDAALTVGGAKSTYLPLLGDRGMEGNLDMGNNIIKFCGGLRMENDGKSSINMNNSNIYRLPNPVRGDNAANKTYVDNRDNLNLPLNGSRTMTGDLNMGGNAIIILKDPNSSDSFHAPNVNYVNRTISDNNAVINSLIEDKVSQAEALNIKANRQDNEFSFVMDDDLFKEDDDDITKVRKVDKDYYDINKATYQFKIKYDSAIGYYSTRLTIDLKSLDLGEYTLAFEMYYNDKVDHDEVVVDAVSDTLNVSRNNTNTFSDHSRTIVNFHKYGNIEIIDLDIDLTLKYKNPPYDAETDIFVVLYGVTGHQNDVDSRIWDRFYTIRNKIVYYEAPIDMGNRQIKRLSDGNENGDAVNVKQLNETEDNIVKYVDGEIAKVNSEIAKENPTINENKNFLDLLVKYILRNESKFTLIKDLYFSDNVEGRTPNTYVFRSDISHGIDELTFYYVFQHNSTTNSVMSISFKTAHFGINHFIHIDKSRVVISGNPLIDEPSLRTFNIPINSLGKQVLLWIWVKENHLNIFFSGISSPIIVNDFLNENVVIRVNVDDNPFTKKRGLITKNVWDNNSTAFENVKEFEKSQGTII